ncbi:hypothetical protein E2562_014065 [Oryza meyeriana var. granulata]|uniref:Uncharacterized protein n=1 Tax=Oryza meyeriana var. granulata TaxID=110450 RepID=A0A6G1DL27_9ORYZ|nr:hypothetical protein E2562_014065 [Oryza meyeriana var. granulata]KAF0912424.1 hypothetical protein E2562_014065 [Oryza meyeriana var. granulata]KAF0912425.1 hypothetical protein E2562_014065 [Oryza meyeriana var. granulata]KAF0912426.1 hypothetical protein E2562_014065 [Oryza meyeriana var. granulata]
MTPHTLTPVTHFASHDEFEWPTDSELHRRRSRGTSSSSGGGGARLVNSQICHRKAQRFLSARQVLRGAAVAWPVLAQVVAIGRSDPAWRAGGTAATRREGDISIHASALVSV